MISTMKWLLALALTVPLAFAGWFLARDPGRLSVRAWGWQIDTTLVLALLLTGICVLLLWLVYWLIWRLPVHLLAKRRHNLEVQFRHGLEDFAQGRFAKAKRRLLAASAVVENAPLALLHAAQASLHLGESKAAIEIASRAEQYPEVKAAAEVLSAQVKLQAGDISQLDTLDALVKGAAHPLAAPTLARALCERGRAREALSVISELGKKNSADGRSAALEWAAMSRLALAQAPTKEALEEVWQLLNSQEREQHDVLVAYAHSAARLGVVDSTELLLRNAIKDSPSELLWQEYGEICVNLSGDQASTALKFVEKSLAASSPNESPSALLAAAKLCRLQSLGAKGAQYLERSLALGTTRHGLIEQGESRFAQGDHLGAAKAWREALAQD